MSEQERDAWFAAHQEPACGSYHICMLPPTHEGNCRCHCGSHFDHDEQYRRSLTLPDYDDTHCMICDRADLELNADLICVACYADRYEARMANGR